MLILKFIKWLSGFLSKSISQRHSHFLRHRRFNGFAKLIVCFLCFNIIMASTYHVICVEPSSEGIRKAHFQLHDCHYTYNKESGTFIDSYNQKNSQTVHLGFQGEEQSCPECIDEHIQFIKSFPKINLGATTLFKTIFPTIESITNQFLYAKVNYSVPTRFSPLLSSFRTSVIRSTIMLI